MILFDTCAVIYALDPDSPFHAWAQNEIATAVADTGAVVNPVVISEVAIGLSDPSEVLPELTNLGLQLVDLPCGCSIAAARSHSEYLERLRKEGKRGRKMPLPDFFIGAHAEYSGMKIASGDGARFKTYFPSVDVIEPKA